MNSTSRSSWMVVAFVSLTLTTGCATVGPGNVVRDRFDYGSAVATSGEEYPTRWLITSLT